MLKGCLVAIGVIIVVVLIAAGVGYYLLTRPTEIAREMRPVEVSTQAAQSFDQELETFKAQVEAAPAGEEVKLTITEEGLASKVNANIGKWLKEAGVPLEMSSIQINFTTGSAYLLVTATVAYDRFRVPAQVGAEVEIEIIEGSGDTRWFQYKVKRLNIGALPDWAQQEIRDIFVAERMSGTVALSQLAEELWGLDLEDLPIVLNEVYVLETEEGNQLVFSGITVSEEN